MSQAPQSIFHLTGKVIFPAEHLPIMAAKWHYDGDDVIHDHSFIEIALVLAGKAVHRTVYGDQMVGPADAIVLVPGAWHAYVGCEGLALYNCCFRMELLQRELGWTKEDSLLNYLLWAGPNSQDRRGILNFRIPEAALERCGGLLNRLREVTAADGDGAGSRGDQVGHLLLYLAELARHLNPEHHPIDVQAPPVHPSVTRGVQLLEENLAEAWNLSKLAERLFVDPSYLVRLFKAGTGLPPMAYLARARAEHAAVLLLRTDRAVAEIGAEVGWDDPNYFARRFKAHFGLSATDYRRQYRSGGN